MQPFFILVCKAYFLLFEIGTFAKYIVLNHYYLEKNDFVILFPTYPQQHLALNNTSQMPHCHWVFEFIDNLTLITTHFDI